MDDETSLVYMKARFYDPDSGRFLTEDSYLGEQDTPPSLNRYLYSYSNPLKYIDPTGHKSKKMYKDVDEDGNTTYTDKKPAKKKNRIHVCIESLESCDQTNSSSSSKEITWKDNLSDEDKAEYARTSKQIKEGQKSIQKGYHDYQKYCKGNKCQPYNEWAANQKALRDSQKQLHKQYTESQSGNGRSQIEEDYYNNGFGNYNRKLYDAGLKGAEYAETGFRIVSGVTTGGMIYATEVDPINHPEDFLLRGRKGNKSKRVKTEADPNDINFSQRTVSGNVEKYVDDMKNNKWDWNKSGPIRVMRVNGKLVSYDNRRLMAAQRAGLKNIPIEIVNSKSIMPGSKKTWEQAFNKRFNDKRNIQAGGRVPNNGLSEQPKVAK